MRSHRMRAGIGRENPEMALAVRSEIPERSKGAPDDAPNAAMLVGHVGLEPTTYGLRVRSSTN